MTDYKKSIMCQLCILKVFTNILAYSEMEVCEWKINFGKTS